MAMSAAQVTAGLQRKKNLGKEPSNPANLAQYNKLTPATPISAGQAGGTPKATTQGSIPPILNAATNTTGAAPTLGYGSGGTYGKTAGLGQAYSANQALISTDAGRQSEIARSQDVIGELNKALAADPNNADLQNRLAGANKYLTVNLGYSAPKAPEVTAQGNITSSGGYMPQDAVTNVRSSGELQAQSGDSLAIERAALKNAIDTQMASLRNNFDYANKNMNDQRVLEDAKISRTLNPFSGRTGYEKSQVDRGRAIDDTYRNADRNNQLNSLSAEIADFDKLAPERQRQIYNQLLTLERDFGLNVGQITGEYGDKQTLAAKTAQQNYDLGLAVLSGQLPSNAGGGQTLAAKNQALDAQNQAFTQKLAQDQYNRGVFESDRDFQENKRRYGLDYAIQQKSQQLQQQNMANDNALGWANNALSAQDNALAREKFDYDKEQVSNTPKSDHEIEADLISGLDSLDPSERKNALIGEKSNIIKQFGKSYYDSLYKSYFPDEE